MLSQTNQIPYIQKEGDRFVENVKFKTLWKRCKQKTITTYLKDEIR